MIPHAQNADPQKDFLKGRRLVFGVGDAKEKAEQVTSPEEENFDRRKQQARAEIDSIYESGKYDTYNFRKLPQEFKDHMRNNFGQWIDSNIAKYDKDKDSGINAAEYAEFKNKLNEKVSEILDRLIEAKEQKKKQAIENKETAEQAKEAQKRLEGVNTDKLNEANLENEDGCYTELLSYQKDFEKESAGFAALAGVFSGTKEKADNANKSHTTGITAFGEMLYNWYEDIPEVKDAKAAKAQAIADFRAKLAEMRKRLKERQARGSTLNGAPEKIRGRIAKEYGEAKEKTRSELAQAKKADEENRREQERLTREIEENEKRRKAAQKEYDMLVIRLQQAAQRKAEVEKRTGEMREATTGFDRTAEAAKAERKRTGGAAMPAQPGRMSVEDLERQAGESARKAKEVTGDLETGLKAADQAVGGMSGSAMVIQRRLADLNSARRLMSSDLSKREKTGTLITDVITAHDENLGKITTEENQRLEQVDALDSAIAETVLQVDTANFELIKKGEGYLKTLESMDVSGPGLLDTAGAMIMGIPGAETAYNWSGDKLSGAWQWAKGAPVLGAGIEIVGYMGEGWVKAWDAIGDGFSWVGDKMHLGEAWDWMSEASKHTSIGNPTGNAAIDAILDTFSGGGLGTIIEVFAGVTEGAKGLVQGVGMMLQHPFETIKGLGGLLNHPGKIIDALIQKDRWGDESSSKIIGRAIFDVITTLTGGGAAATSVKTALTAMKFGGMGVGKAILLALKTFPKVFIQDIGKVILGVVKIPATALRGVADLFKWIGRGGKKLEPVKGAGTAAAKMAAREQDAVRALETARNNPGELVKWLEKYPDQVDLAYRMMQEERAAAKVKKQARKKTSTAGKEETQISGDEAKAVADDSTRPEGRDKGPKRATGEEPTRPADMEAVMRHENRPSEKNARRAKKREEARETMTNELRAAEKRLLERRPDYKPKPLTPERMKQMMEIQDRLHTNKSFAALSKKLEENLAELRKRHAEDLSGISPGDPRYREMRRMHIGEEARLDARRLLDALPEDELEMLGRSLDDLDETMMSRVLNQEYTMVLDTAGRPVRIYVGDAINQGTFGMVHDVAYVVGTEKRINTGAAMKRPRNMASLRADPDYKHAEVAQINDLLNSIEVNFYNEVRTFSAVRDFRNRDGLLQPRVISTDLRSQFIIYDKIDAGPGEPVRLKDRILRDDKPEEILGFAADSMDGERNLARNGTNTASPDGWYHLDIKPENIFVGFDENGRLRGYLGDLSLNNVEDVASIRLIEVPAAKTAGSRNFGVLKVDRTDFSKSVQIGTTPGYFSYDHVVKSFDWVKDPANAGKAVPESIMALPGNHAHAVLLERTFFTSERDAVHGLVNVFRDDTLPLTNREALVIEIIRLIRKLKDPDSGIDITMRQAEFRRIEKMIKEAREKDRVLAE
jgi:hypothetical protein